MPVVKLSLIRGDTSGFEQKLDGLGTEAQCGESQAPRGSGAHCACNVAESSPIDILTES